MNPVIPQTPLALVPLPDQPQYPADLAAQADPVSRAAIGDKLAAIGDKLLGAASSGNGGGGASPTFSADPVSAITGSVASIWGDIAGLLQGQQTQKILAQQGQLTEKDQFNAIIALSQQQTAAAAAKQRNNLILTVVLVLAALGVAALVLTRKSE